MFSIKITHFLFYLIKFGIAVPIFCKQILYLEMTFSPEKGNEIKRIAETMAESTKAMVNEALFE